MSTFIMQYTQIPNYKSAKHQCRFYRRSGKVGCVNGQKRCCTFQCNAKPGCTTTPTIQRRSGNYKPPIWDFDFIQSLSNEYKEDRYAKRASMLMVQVKILLDDYQKLGHVQQLELIDDLQRLGISYHFQEKINQILNHIYFEYINYEREKRDLYSTALGFRLLRQHGFKISQEVFDNFKNEEGNFKPSLVHNTIGLLQLYEASFLLTQGEKTLELAREFSTKFLEKKLDDDDELDENVSLLVRRALELPVHWRVQRPNARWFIDAYGRRPGMNPNVLDFAKLDFNIVQATHQQELKHVSRWWEKTCLAEKLTFARDRVVECYFWTIGGHFEPQYGYSRIMATKVNVFITIIDDIFDVYGTWEELVQFNDAIQRWDIEAMDQLPNYMQICFLALNNLIDEMAYHVLKEQGILIIPHLRKSWADLFRAYTQEAKWYSTGYTPKLEEYMKNAWISISAPAILSHAFFLITNPIEKEVVESLHKYHNIVKCAAMVLRLANDLGTSPYEMERGDIAKSVECFMNESGGTREEAIEYVKGMIWETWKEMNAERVAESGFSQDFMRSAADLGRMAQYMYQHGDGHGIQNHQTQIKERISTLLFQPIV
ncbi:hypothetical protein ACS0TY_012584 [Phlomoides rotata]